MITTTLTDLTTIFTPPSTCSSSWTYEAEFFNSIPGGLLLQNALSDFLDTECFPTGFSYAGRAPDTIEIFSPGYCPVGYTTATESFNGGTTLAVCCQNDFTYSSTFSLKDQFNSSTVLFAGCLSSFTGGSTAVAARSGVDDSGLNNTVITGVFSMWGQPISVEFQQQDLTLFTTSSTTLSSTSASTSTSATAEPSSSITQHFASSTATISPLSSASSSGLSKGATIGIAVSGGIVVFAIIVAAVIFLRRRRAAKRRPYLRTGETNENVEFEYRHPVEMEALSKTAYVSELE